MFKKIFKKSGPKLTSEQISLKISSIIMFMIAAGGVLCGVLMFLATSNDDLTVPSLAIALLGVLALVLAVTDHKAIKTK
jgi:cytochrome c oxidase subunit IV